MSTVDTLTVPTIAGLSLGLRYHREGRVAGTVSATLHMPEFLSPRLPPLERECAFLIGGQPVRDVYVEPRTGALPATAWIGGVLIHLEDATAASVQAWLDSRKAAAAPPSNAYARLVEELPDVAYRSALA